MWVESQIRPLLDRKLIVTVQLIAVRVVAGAKSNLKGDERKDEDLNRTAVWGLVILGMLFRLRQYLFSHSLWLDESFLALNIIRRSLAGLLKPLDFNQGAPIGFLWLEKMAAHSFGSSEIALRFIPFLAGIASMVLFALVSRKFLAPRAVPIAVGLFAFCHPLIYYANEAKQYSTDVAAVLVLYLIASLLVEAQLGTVRAIVISVTGAAAVWLSHPAAFVVAVLALVSLWTSSRGNDRPALLKVAIVVATWFCSFLACYRVSLGGIIHNRRLLDYWGGAFAPFPLSSPANAIWYVNSFFGIFSDPAGLPFTGIAAACAAVGAMELFDMHKGKFFLLVLPLHLLY